jgi:hypothetical protein
MFIYTKNNNITTHKFLNIFNSNVILNVTVFCSDTLNLKKYISIIVREARIVYIGCNNTVIYYELLSSSIIFQ